MFANRRRSERRLHGGAAKLHLGQGSYPRDCKILDISDGGVRVVAERVSVPSEFTIVMDNGVSRRGSSSRCGR